MQRGSSASGGGGDERAKRVTVLAIIAAIVLLVIVAVVLTLTLTGDDEDDPVPTAGSGSSSSASSSSSSPAPAPADLLARLPEDFTDCQQGQLEGDGDLAAAVCGPAVTQPGPAGAVYYAYPDVATLSSVFADDTAELRLDELPEGDDCSTTTGHGEWTHPSGVTGGLVACALLPDGDVVIVWTDDEHLVEGAVHAPGTTQDDVAELYEWWTLNSYFTG